MSFIFVLITIIQFIAISLGVGCSTLAITNFFVAMADGKIDANERRMMGIVYVLLRIAMVFIMLTAVLIAIYNIGILKLSATPFVFAQWTLIAILFANAGLMTKHLIPSNIGPAIQAATWYSLGVMLSLLQLQMVSFSYLQFAFGYIAALALGVAIVNGVMTALRHKQKLSM